MTGGSRGDARWIGPAWVVAAGAGLGWWMFGLPGAALFAAVAAAVVAAFGVMGPHARGLAAALALALAGAALHSASTLGWAGADAPDGTRFKVSPVGLSRVLTPDQPVSTTVDCGWYGAAQYEAPCAVAPGGEAAFRRLLLVEPLVWLAVLLCVAGAFLSLRPAWRLGFAQRLAAAGAAAAALLALRLFAGSVGDALAALAGLSVGVGGTLGTMQLTAAILLCLATSLAPRPPPGEALTTTRHGG